LPYNRAIIASHQAPFGSDTVKVKLHKIVSEDWIIGEFIFENGFVSEHKEYLKFFTGNTHYATAYFKRKNGQPFTYEKFTALWDPEINWIDDHMDTRVTHTFEAPESDSTWNVIEKQPNSELISRKYFFNQKGFISGEYFAKINPDPHEYKVVYSRNQQNNIVEAIYHKNDEAKKYNSVSKVSYMHDSHPNPFFLIGLDWTGDRSIFTFSPNNIVQETIYFEDTGQTSVTTFKYEYFPNGYPSKLTIKNVLGEIDQEPQVINFTYY
jgi:hypothetical protein